MDMLCRREGGQAQNMLLRSPKRVITQKSGMCCYCYLFCMNGRGNKILSRIRYNHNPLFPELFDFYTHPSQVKLVGRRLPVVYELAHHLVFPLCQNQTKTKQEYSKGNTKLLVPIEALCFVIVKLGTDQMKFWDWSNTERKFSHSIYSLAEVAVTLVGTGLASEVKMLVITQFVYIVKRPGPFKIVLCNWCPVTVSGNSERKGIVNWVSFVAENGVNI